MQAVITAGTRSRLRGGASAYYEAAAVIDTRRAILPLVADIISSSWPFVLQRCTGRGRVSPTTVFVSAQTCCRRRKDAGDDDEMVACTSPAALQQQDQRQALSLRLVGVFNVHRRRPDEYRPHRCQCEIVCRILFIAVGVEFAPSYSDSLVRALDFHLAMQRTWVTVALSPVCETAHWWR